MRSCRRSVRQSHRPCCLTRCLSTAPVALEVVTSPGPFPKVSVPINPPSTLLPPPVTVPVAELDENRAVSGSDQAPCDARVPHCHGAARA